MFNYIEQRIRQDLEGIRSLEAAALLHKGDRIEAIYNYISRHTGLLRITGEGGVSVAASIVHTFLFEELSGEPYSFSWFHSAQKGVKLQELYMRKPGNQRIGINLWETARDDLGVMSIFFDEAVRRCMSNPGYIPRKDGEPVRIPQAQTKEFANGIAMVVSHALLGEVFKGLRRP